MKILSKINSINGKADVFFILTLAVLMLMPIGVEAQRKGVPTCDKAYWSARDLYYSGRYENVGEMLDICLGDFESNADFFRENKPEQVFKVYKLIINSYYNMDYDNRAEEERKKLIDFFYGMYSKDEVLERIKRTRF